MPTFSLSESRLKSASCKRAQRHGQDRNTNPVAAVAAVQVCSGSNQSQEADSWLAMLRRLQNRAFLSVAACSTGDKQRRPRMPCATSADRKTVEVNSKPALPNIGIDAIKILRLNRPISPNRGTLLHESYRQAFLPSSCNSSPFGQKQRAPESAAPSASAFLCSLAEDCCLPGDPPSG